MHAWVSAVVVALSSVPHVTSPHRYAPPVHQLDDVPGLLASCEPKRSNEVHSKEKQ